MLDSEQERDEWVKAYEEVRKKVMSQSAVRALAAETEGMSVSTGALP